MENQQLETGQGGGKVEIPPMHSCAGSTYGQPIRGAKSAICTKTGLVDNHKKGVHHKCTTSQHILDRSMDYRKRLFRHRRPKSTRSTSLRGELFLRIRFFESHVDDLTAELVIFGPWEGQAR